MTIGFAQVGDMISWLDLLERVTAFFPGLDIADYRKILAIKIQKEEAVAAWIDGSVIGALLFSRESKEIEFLAVHPDFRNKSAATEIVRFMLSLFPVGVTVSVTTYRENDEKGTAARALYRKLGFQSGPLVTVFDYPCQELVYVTI